MQISSAPSDRSSGPNRPGIPQMPDEALIDAIIDGDGGALQKLYARHQDRIFLFLTRLIRDPSLAEEIVNEVFLAVWRHASEFKGRSRVFTWLAGIARYKAMSALKRRTEAQLPDDVATSIEDPSDNAAAKMEKDDRRIVLQRCLAKLPPTQREVIDRFYFQDEPIQDVARRMGVATSTIKTRMFYARTRMAELLKEAGVDRAWL